MHAKYAVIIVFIWSSLLIVLFHMKTTEVKFLYTHQEHYTQLNYSFVEKEKNKFGLIPSLIGDKSNYILKNLEELKNFFFVVNNLQVIHNWDLYSDIDLVIVVQVHDRVSYLRQLITSLSEASHINKTLVIFSHDFFDAEINSLVQTINFTKVMQIFYPFSIQTHPNEFPGPDRGKSNLKDSFGHSRSAQKCQIKHHWWWKINFVFSKIRILKNYFGTVLFLEEDHYLAPDFIHCLKLMADTAKKYCPRCWFLSLAYWRHLFIDKSKKGVQYDHVLIQESVENLGLAFNRTIWYNIFRLSEVFCKYDDYNWDWTLRYLIYNTYANIITPKPLSMIMGIPRIEHIGVCGIHATSNSCIATTKIENFKRKQVKLFPLDLRIIKTKNVYQVKKNGGWGDPRDQALCLGMM